MIVSLHMPKAGGSSFKEILKKEFNKTLLLDYKDIPLNKSVENRTRDVLKYNQQFRFLQRPYLQLRRVKCIHGHFLPYKYQKLSQNKNVHFITWLREPTERLISQYYYWFRTYNEQSYPLHKKIVEEQWSLEQFCLSEEMRNVYTQFLWQFPIENFNFIGVTEFYNEDMNYFAKKHLGKTYLDKDIPFVNTNNGGQRNYSTELSSVLLNKIRAHHSKDYEIYTKALEIRKGRME